MTGITLASPSALNKWSLDYQREYVRQSTFMPYMGTDDTSIIYTDKQTAKGKSDTVHYPYFRPFTSAGLTGSTLSFGNEDVLANYSTAVKLGLIRNVTFIPESQAFRTELDVADVARGSLKQWSANKLKNDIISTLGSVVIPGGTASDGTPAEDTYVPYGSATSTQLNTYLTNNSDRILFGTANGNQVSGNFASSLANITSSQKAGSQVVNMAKALAQKTGTFKINPYQSDVTAGREFYVMFVGIDMFRDLSQDNLIYAANQNARERDVDTNPIFQSGDLMYNGVIIREVPDMVSLGPVGASSAVVAPYYLCGARAMTLTWAKFTEPRAEDYDLRNQMRLAVVEIRGQSKNSAGGVQTGMVSGFCAASPDA